MGGGDMQMDFNDDYEKYKAVVNVLTRKVAEFRFDLAKLKREQDAKINRLTADIRTLRRMLANRRRRRRRHRRRSMSSTST